MQHQDEPEGTLVFIEGYLRRSYFHRGWFEIGQADAAEGEMESVERTLGILTALLNADIGDERFAELCQLLGMEYQEFDGEPAFRDIVTDLHAGMLEGLAIRTLALTKVPGATRNQEGDSLYQHQQFLGGHFYQSWTEHEPPPSETGYIIGSMPGSIWAERMLGALSAFLHMDIPNEDFRELCSSYGVNYREIRGHPTFREILEKVRAGMLKGLTERTLALVNDLT